MNIIDINFGPNKMYGIELGIFNFDPIDMAIGSWEIIAAKVCIKFFGLNFVLFSLEISDTRVSLGVLNCFLSAFWG